MTFSSFSPATLSQQLSSTNLRVEQPGFAWQRQQPRWTLIEALLGGTLQLQAGGKQWLPQEPREAEESYRVRLANSVCAPYYVRLEALLAGMLTRKPVRLENVPEVVTQHLFDVDLQGNDLNVWSFQFAKTLIRYGHAGVLVDYGREDGVTTDRPYWVTYTPRDILGFRTSMVDGTQKLTQLRLYERLTLPIPGSEYGEEVVEQVRVLEPGAFKLFQKRPSKTSGFELVEEGATTMRDIPFAIAYSNRTGLLESQPPLEEVAHLNLQAYRRSSDLANQLHIAAVPRHYLFGVPAEVDELEAGPESALALPVDARAEWSEPTGTSYEFQFRHLAEIERQISQLGLAAVLGQQTFQESGVAKAIDRSQGDSALMSVALQLQDLIDTCLDFHRQYLGLPSGGNAVVNRDFVSQRLDPQEVAQLIALEAAGKITQETLLQRLADGEWLGELDVQGELDATAALQQARIDAQAATLQGAMAAMPGSKKPPAPGQGQAVPPAA